MILDVRLIVFGSLTLSLMLASVAAQQDCPSLVPGRPWRLRCLQFCCVEDTDDPLDGQFCCSTCSSSFDPAVRNAFSCTANHYLHKTWAVVLMSCGIAFIILVCCTCCCCCCCAPCRGEGRRRRAREYTLTKQPVPHYQHYQYSTSSHYGSCGISAAATADEAAPSHPRPSAPPASSAAASSPPPPPYKAASALVDQPPPPVYRP